MGGGDIVPLVARLDPLVQFIQLHLARLCIKKIKEKHNLRLTVK